MADTEEILKEYAEMEEEDEKNRKDDEDRLLDELASQGIHKNLSFFAFTATPKGRHYKCLGRKTQVILKENDIDLFMYIL